MEMCCDSSWGIGVNFKNDSVITTYGYPESRDPNLFYPDFECCSGEEIEAWEKAKVEWDKKHEPA